MLTDILNSVIYLLTAQLLHLGGCLIADVKLRTRNDPQLLEWVGSYCKEHYAPYGEIKNNASRLAEICRDMHASHAVIGGAPYFMGPLEQALRKAGIVPLYAFTERVAVEVTDPITGEVTKTSKFNFAGWIEGVL